MDERIEKNIENSQLPNIRFVADCLSDYTLTQLLKDRDESSSYLARDRSGRNVRIDILHISRISSWESVDKAKNSAKIMRTLDIDGIPKILDIIDSDRDALFCVVTEYRGLRSLRELLDEERRFSYKQCLSIVEETSAILRQLHRLKPALIHRNVKPSSIYLDSNAKVWLGDFQNAVSAYDVYNDPDIERGFYAPEHVAGHAVPESDYYSLGATVLSILTSADPSQTLNLESCHDNVSKRDKIRRIVEDATDGNADTLKHRLVRLLDPEPEMRIKNATAISKNSAPARLIHDLSDVRVAGESGSIQLFRALADSTPRPVPPVYERRWNSRYAFHRTLSVILISTVTSFFTFVAIYGITDFDTDDFGVNLAAIIIILLIAYLPVQYFLSVNGRKTKDRRYRMIKNGVKQETSVFESQDGSFAYTYELPDRSVTQRFDIRVGAPVPDTIGILYDPQNPSDHIVYPFPLTDIDK